MSADLGVSESATGQSVTDLRHRHRAHRDPPVRGHRGMAAQAAAAHRDGRFRRRQHGHRRSPPTTPLTMAARFVAGVAAGLAWALLAGYARRLAPVHLQGRAIAIAMAGIPVALSLGVPAGTFLGDVARLAGDVRCCMTVLAVVLLGWIAAAVPDHPGPAATGGPESRCCGTLTHPRCDAGPLRHAGLRAGPHDPLHLHRHVPRPARHGRLDRPRAAGLRRRVPRQHLVRGRAHRPAAARPHVRRAPSSSPSAAACWPSWPRAPSSSTPRSRCGDSAGEAPPPCCRRPWPTRAATRRTPPRPCSSRCGTRRWPPAGWPAASCSTGSARARSRGAC